MVMNPKSAQSLAWFAGILLGLAFVVAGGGIAFAGLAAIVALAPAIFARGTERVISIVLLVASLASAGALYPEYQRYVEHARANYHKGTPPPPDTKK